MRNKETKIIIAGFGGQGVVLTGNVIARAAVIEGKNITGMVSYGVEMRGGTANASVIVSDGEIASPFVEYPNAAIILNHPSLDKFEPVLAENCDLVINTSMIHRCVERHDINVGCIDASNIARESIGNSKVANIVALGAFIKETELFTPESIEQAIKDLFAKKKPELAEINIKAFRVGIEALTKACV